MAATSPADFSSLPCPSSTQDTIDPITAEYHTVLPFLLLPCLSSQFFPAWCFLTHSVFCFLTLTCISDGCLLSFLCIFLLIAHFPQAQAYLPLFTPLNLSPPVCFTSPSMLSLPSKMLCFYHQDFSWSCANCIVVPATGISH